MKLDNDLFDEILLRAQESPRRRMNFDLRTQAQIPGQTGNDVRGGAGNVEWKDQSQRMLNAIEPGSVVPIHR